MFSVSDVRYGVTLFSFILKKLPERILGISSQEEKHYKMQYSYIVK